MKTCETKLLNNVTSHNKPSKHELKKGVGCNTTFSVL